MSSQSVYRNIDSLWAIRRNAIDDGRPNVKDACRFFRISNTCAAVDLCAIEHANDEIAHARIFDRKCDT